MLRPSASRQDSRKKSFKKSADAEESRRKREDQMIAIRKEKREEAMAKKRINVGGGGGGGDQQIHPNVFDTSDSTAMTHEQRTHAKVRSFVRSSARGRRGGREICFFFKCAFCRPRGCFQIKGKKGTFRARGAGAIYEYEYLPTNLFVCFLLKTRRVSFLARKFLPTSYLFFCVHDARLTTSFSLVNLRSWSLCRKWWTA